MNKRKASIWLSALLVVSMLAGCSGSQPAPVLVQAAPGTGSTSSGVSTGTTAVVTTGTQSGTASVDAGATSAAAVAASNDDDHDSAEDYVWDESRATRIVLDGSAITIDGDGVIVDGSKATITSAGTYVISGTLDDGQIIVNATDQDLVRLVLSGADIHSSTGAAIQVAAADEVVILLVGDTENSLSDGESRVAASADEDEPNAAIYSMADLTLAGDGALTVDGNYRDGIVSKDGLILAGGTITVRAQDDGIRGKDYVVVKDGEITITAGGDGLKSDNEEDPTRGYIWMQGGLVNITSAGDAIAAKTDVLVTGGELDLTAGGGNNGRIAADASAKGIKAVVSVNIDGGTLTVDSADDAIHSNGSITINGGTFVLSSGDDAIHADATLLVNGGQLTIDDSYEGLESAVITVNAGDIHLTASDDGINVSGGGDASGMTAGPGRGGGPGGDMVAYSANNWLYVNGGYIVVNAAGDGIDANGNIEMTGGVVIVNGPTEQMNGALDCVGSFNVNGGLLIAVGSSGMAESPDATSSQYSLLLNLNGTLQAGALIHIQSADGADILTFAPAKRIQSIVFSSPELKKGATYTVYYGGSSTGTAADGLYAGGTYSGGTRYTSLTLSGIVTTVGGLRR